MRAIGTDLNPLAVLVARAKTWTVPAKRRAQLRDVGHAISGEVLAAGKAARRAGAEPGADAQAGRASIPTRATAGSPRGSRRTSAASSS